MQTVIITLVTMLSAYFILAAFYRPLRIRYGISSVNTIYPKGVPKQHYGKPRMGGLFCFGLGLFLAGISVLHFGMAMSSIPSIAALMMLTGVVLGFIGQFRDKS